MVAGRLFCHKVKTFYWWYRHVLSDYLSDKEGGKWCSEKIASVDKKTGEVKEKPVYVFTSENLGSSMSIDDKAIGHDGFTILSNHETGKIAMMVESTRADEVEQAWQSLATSCTK